MSEPMVGSDVAMPILTSSLRKIILLLHSKLSKIAKASPNLKTSLAVKRMLIKKGMSEKKNIRLYKEIFLLEVRTDSLRAARVK